GTSRVISLPCPVLVNQAIVLALFPGRCQCGVMQNSQQSPPADDPHAVLAELNSRLDRLVEDAGPDSWTLDTPARGWDVGMQIAHLAWTDEVSLAAVEDPDAFAAVVEQAMADPTGFVDAGAAEIASARRDEVLPRWRSAREQLGPALARSTPGRRSRGSARRCGPGRWRPPGSWRRGRTAPTSPTPSASGSIPIPPSSRRCPTSPGSDTGPAASRIR